MSSDAVSIRAATTADVDALAQFNCAIASETEEKQLDAKLVRSGVARGLEKTGEVQYFVAEANGRPVGCLMLTREWSDWRDGWIIWIQSVYVVAEFRGQGVFKALLAHATEYTRQSPDNVGLRLYVEVENSRAQEVYTRCGFRDPSYKVMEKIWG